MRFVTAALLLIPLVAAAQRGQPIQLTLDYSTFAYDEAETLVDVYLAFEAATLPFAQTPEGDFAADIPLYLRMAPASVVVPGALEPETVWADSSMLRFSVQDTIVVVQGQQFVHVARAAVPPGEYAVEVRVPESGPRPELRVVSEVRVPSYAAERVLVSDLLLASRIAPGAAASDPFYRNGLSVQPNASALFGEGLSTLYYYAEVYNARAAAGADGQYGTRAFVTQAGKTAAMDGLDQTRTREGRPVDVLVGSFDLADVPTGSYFLRLHALAPDGAVLAEQSRKFFHYNPSVEPSQGDRPAETFESSPFALMTQEEAEQMIEQVSVVLTSAEQRRARALPNLDAQRRFLRDVWAVRDPSPNTSANEFRDQFEQRLRYAEERYATGRQPGWKTDRGRILLRYGLPDETEPHLFDRGIEPHEIWRYRNIPGEGQSEFVFADDRGFGDFRLIHSNVRGERQNPGWRQELAQ